MIRLSVNAKKELNRGADQILGDGRIVIGIERDNHKEIENCQNQKKDEEIKAVDYSQFEASTKSGIHADVNRIRQKFGPLLVECRKGRCLGIEIEILEQFMADGAAFHGYLEMEERAERDFPVTGEIDSGAPTEILMVLIHLFDFGQQNLFDFFRVGHGVPPLVKSETVPMKSNISEDVPLLSKQGCFTKKNLT